MDKPEGPSSFDVVARLRKVFQTRTIGHAGTLDPLATGVLVVAVGSYTRLLGVLSADDKRYLAQISFGTSTTTDDREGQIVSRGDPSCIHEDQVRAALATMLGRTQQVPPVYSAVHIDGERAYDLARRGESVEMKSREVVIQSLSLLELTENIAVVDVRCEKGTYVRAIARDLGEKIGVPAHLFALRRTVSGAYTLADAVPLASVERDSLRTGVSALRGVTLVAVENHEAQALAQGKRVRAAGSFEGVALAHEGERPVALVRFESDMLVVQRGFG